MGNGASASINVNVDWGRDFEVAHAGQPLKGNVVVKVKRPIKGGLVRLRVTGKEKTVVRTGKQSHKAERPILTVDMPLKRFPEHQKVRPGTYTFPFTIPLHPSLPSSVAYPSSGDTSKQGFRIQYKMVATVGKGWQLEKVIYFRMAAAPLPNERVPCVIQPTSFPLNSMMGLLDKGNVTLGASVADSHIGRGEHLELQLACRNDSTANIQRVEIKLMERMVWHSAGGAAGYTRTAKTPLLILNDVDLPSIAKARKDRQEVRRSKGDQRAFHVTYASILEDLVSGRNKIDIHIPSFAKDTYKGKLFEVSHALEVKIKTGSLTSNPTSVIPLRIGIAPDRRPRPTTTTSSPAAAAAATSPTSPAGPLPGPLPVAEADIYVPAADSTPGAGSAGEIPIVAAVALPGDDVHRASMIAASENVIVLGGDAILQNESQTDLSDLVPMAPPPPETEVSIASLLRRMSTSINDFELVSTLLLEPEWVQLFATMSPNDYGNIISRVNIAVDQPRVAVRLAEYVRGGGDRFTCDYAAAAVRNTSEWYRSTTAQRLLPLCVDVSLHHELIGNELNEWERTVTSRDFEEALTRGTRTTPINSGGYAQ